MAKSFSTISVLLIILLTGCGKTHPPLPVTLTGKWRALSTSGGIGGTTTVFTGEMRILLLNTDSTFSVTSNGALLQSGVYSFSVVATGGHPDSLITFKATQTNSVAREWTHLHEQGMQLIDDLDDGYSTYYVKNQ